MPDPQIDEPCLLLAGHHPHGQPGLPCHFLDELPAIDGFAPCVVEGRNTYPETSDSYLELRDLYKQAKDELSKLQGSVPRDGRCFATFASSTSTRAKASPPARRAWRTP